MRYDEDYRDPTIFGLEFPECPKWSVINRFADVVDFIKMLYCAIALWIYQPKLTSTGEVIPTPKQEMTKRELKPLVYGLMFLAIGIALGLGCYSINVVSIGLALSDPDPIYVPILDFWVNPVSVYALILVGFIIIFGAWYFDSNLITKIGEAISRVDDIDAKPISQPDPIAEPAKGDQNATTDSGNN
jgi:hypothetical protein